MPLVRIDLPQGKPPEYRQTVGDVVYEAMRTTLNVPENDRFQVIAEHAAGGLVIDPTYLGIARSADALMIQVTLNAGRSVELKKAFYRAVADGLHERWACAGRTCSSASSRCPRRTGPSATARRSTPDRRLGPRCLRSIVNDGAGAGPLPLAGRGSGWGWFRRNRSGAF